MVLKKTLKHYKIRSKVPPVNGSVEWSSDNQIAVINRKGVMIFELTGDPKSDSDKEFSPTRTFISASKDLPKVHSGYSDEDVFKSLDKTTLFDLMLDRVLTPRGLAGMEFNNYFVRLQWSPNPFDSANPYYKPKCLLAGLTSNFQLKIYDTKNRRQYIDKKEIGIVEELIPTPSKTTKETEEDPEAVKYHDGWLPLLDLTKSYNEILYPMWTTHEESSTGFCMATYKERMYELAIVDFSWIEPWEDVDETNFVSANMMTVQANGDIVIWRIFFGEGADVPLRSEMLFKENVVGNRIVSTHKFIKITNNLALLALGFKKGGISVLRVESVSENQISTFTGQYWMGHMENLWESDELEIQLVDFVIIPEEEIEDMDPCVCLIAIKHPNTIICFKLLILHDKIAWMEISRCQSSMGHIVALARYYYNVFLVNHDNGKLGFLKVTQDAGAYFFVGGENFIINEEEEEKEDEEEDQSNENGGSRNEDAESSLWLHHGFALSPNKILGCFSKALTITNDTIIIKEPSECTFVSLFPTKDAWLTVQEMYKAHNYSLQKIHDVLQGFRHQMRVSKDFDPDRYLDGKSFAEMSLAEVKLYLWTLKAMGLPKPWKFVKQDYVPKDQLAAMKLNIVKNIALVEEQVMEKYMQNVLETFYAGLRKREDNFHNLLDDQSAFIIRQYLQSKMSPAISKIPNSAVGQPVPCPECGEELSFLKNQDYDASTGITRPGIPGYRWKGQTCVNQHIVSVCVLSFVPFDYPNRVCPFCGCAAVMEPVFEQKPVCPFCEEFMEFEPMVMSDEGEEGIVEEVEQMEI